MNPQNLIEKFETYGVIPVISIEEPDLALPLADALIEGGLPIAEITFRTKAAGKVIERLKKERPQLLVGAGTVISKDNLIMAKECGAEFGVAPGLNPAIVSEAQKIDFPFFPGVMTPSDVERGISMDLTCMKFFPSEASGGVKMIKAVWAPFRHLGVRFIPTGGINMGNLDEYLNVEPVVAVGGTWIAGKEMISSEKWDVIRNNAQAAIKRVRANLDT